MADEMKSEWTAGHPVSGIANLNVPEEIARLKSGAQRAAGDRAAEALAKNSELSVTLIVLKQVRRPRNIARVERQQLRSCRELFSLTGRFSERELLR